MYYNQVAFYKFYMQLIIKTNTFLNEVGLMLILKTVSTYDFFLTSLLEDNCFTLL